MSKGKSLIKLTTGSEKLLFFMPANAANQPRGFLRRLN